MQDLHVVGVDPGALITCLFFYHHAAKMRRSHRTVRDFFAAAVGLAAVARLRATTRDVRLAPGLRADANRATAWALTLTVWPLVWNALADEAAPAAKVGFLWPFVVLAGDLYGATARVEKARAPTRLEQGTVCSLAMWLCGMASMSGAKTPAHQRLFVLPLLAYVVLVVPSSGDESVTLVAPLQHATSACITGLLIAGVLYRREMLPAADVSTAARAPA